MDEYNVIHKLENIGKNILDTTRSELYMTMRFLSMAFGGFQYALSDKTPTLGTDGYYIYYNPMFLIEKYRLDAKWILRTYLHMVMHCIFRHPSSREEREKRLWNLSCDVAAEYIIDSFSYSHTREDTGLEKNVMYGYLKDLKAVSAQGVYRAIIKHGFEEEQIARFEDAFKRDDHSFWTVYDSNPDCEFENTSSNNKNDKDDNSENDDKNTKGAVLGTGDKDNKGKDIKAHPDKNEFDNKWSEISSKTQTDMDTFSKEMAENAGKLVKYINIENRQKYSYKDYLKKFFVTREVMRLDLDSFDYIYYTYGLKKYSNMPLIEPLEYKETKKIDEFAIILDTSASCEGDIIKGFLRETYSVLSDCESFFRKINVHIIQCDSVIQDDMVITDKTEFEKYMNSFEAKGFGGIDFRPAFNYMDKLIADKKADFKGVLYFTDGYGVFPKKMPKYKTAFVFLSESYTDEGVPNWADEIIIEEDELYRYSGGKRN
ncbi:MAG: VWA-like domain-containing protein [Clostridia bacterium]|jgi:predicted metal-dependent peptidase|nr:VWA-like domain-containing protein [Clostridia bacterium]MCI2013734.1 VWA-like domain-containing protein [Clostridia bacterium]